MAAQPRPAPARRWPTAGCASWATPSPWWSAETKAAAVDAAEAVIVDYDPLPAVVDMEEALAPGAPLQFEELGTNLAAGVRDATEATTPSTGADVVVRARFENQRVAVVPMEGNAIAVVPGDDGDGHDAHRLRRHPDAPRHGRRSIDTVFGLDTDERARHRPPRGRGLRRQGRDRRRARRGRGRGPPAGPPGEVGRDPLREPGGHAPRPRARCSTSRWASPRDGTITGPALPDRRRRRRLRRLRRRPRHRARRARWPRASTASRRSRYDVAVAVTNTTPMGAFRGAGRPEAAAFLERIMDIAADELGIDPVELRRRNLLQRRRVPAHHADGRHLRQRRLRAVPSTRPSALAGYDDLRAEQAERRARGDRVQLGIGVAAYVEITAGGRRQRVRRGRGPRRRHRHHPGGHVGARPGPRHLVRHARRRHARHPDGVDHASCSPTPPLVPRGGGTGGSRSLQIGGNAVARRREARAGAGPGARRRAARGRRRRHRRDRRRPPRRGRRARQRRSTLGRAGRAAADGGEPLAAEIDFTPAGATFPFGAHVAVVEVDTETGQGHARSATSPSTTAAASSTRCSWPGQQHGGIAQGMAQALWEQFVYDADGNPLTSTLADYAMPSAAEFPSFEAANTETPTPLNPLGRQGHRRVGHDRLHAGGAERGGRRPEPPRRAPHRHAVHARAGVAGDPGRPGGHRRRRCGVSRPAAFADLPMRGQRRKPTPEEELNV